MITYKQINKPSYIIDYITCDICKKKYDVYEDYLETQEFLSMREIGGYGSIFGDTKEINVDICQHCLKKIFDENNIKI